MSQCFLFRGNCKGIFEPGAGKSVDLTQMETINRRVGLSLCEAPLWGSKWRWHGVDFFSWRMACWAFKSISNLKSIPTSSAAVRKQNRWNMDTSSGSTKWKAEWSVPTVFWMAQRCLAKI
jgi:hypothetical protein